MERQKRILFIGLVGIFLICVFFGFREKLEDFLFFEIIRGENLQSEDLEKYYATFKPLRNWEVEDLEIKAEAAISVAIDQEGKERFLFKKNSKKILPIASLTKLMVALIVLENYDLSERVEISKEAAMAREILGVLMVGESFFVKDLLYSLLMESNNEAAQALSEVIGQKKFVELMNKKAKEFGLSDTYFSNPTGLDPADPRIPPSYSTAEDLIILSEQLLKEPLIWEILKTETFELYTTDSVYHHEIKNNNELLGKIPRILGGKTGHTLLANECLLTVLEGPRSNFLINIVLGSQDRFEEMKKIIDWVDKAYKW